MGFRDATGKYMTEHTYSGVWLSNVPLGYDEGAKGDELLAVAMDISDAEADEHEWAGEHIRISRMAVSG